MQTSQDLEKRVREDAKDVFRDYLGNALNVAAGFAQLYMKTYNEDELTNLRSYKMIFFRKVDKFLARLESEINPKGKINPANIRRFYEFKGLDWTDEKVLARILSYYYSLSR